ncbi:hypothetical protein HMPREF6745_0298 [Prevotella sp. oral taxon 472 str. F0295]|nr:hypothetical protein HMPREF6745_0298 [Prevotella sp. oral taxon 472 str. F0295]
MSLHDKLLIRKKVIIETMNDELKILRQFGIKHNRYAFCCVAIVGEKAISYLSNLVQGAWLLIPNLPIHHSVARIFIVLERRLLSPDDALLHQSSC